jgi:cytosine/adenosine deaminase-related metal-dependent hydrolase
MSSIAPGRVNAHTHLYSGLAPLGLPAPAAAPQNFLQTLERVWWRLDRALDHDTLRAGARLYVAEALLEGTTALIDHLESPNCIEGSLDVLADVCQELGVRAVLCYGVTERNDGADEARRGLDECRRFIESNQRPLVRGVVGLHASFTVSNETIEQAGALARDLGTVVHTHIAEDMADVKDARKRGFAGPLDRLLQCHGLPPGSILAHGVHLTAAEVRTLNDHELWIVQNPRSNRANKVGYPAALCESSRVALGTDGFPADMIDETEALYIDACSHGEDLDKASARLKAGHRLIAERFGVPEGAMMGEEIGAEVSLGRVVVGGRDIVRDGELVTGDNAAIDAEAEEAARKIWERMSSLD